MAGGYEIGLSNSESIANRAGGGDFNLYGSGGKSSPAPWIIAAVAVFALVVLYLFKR